MRNHTIELGDRKGKSFMIKIALPQNWDILKAFSGGGNGVYTYTMTGSTAASKAATAHPGRVVGANWRAIDKGYIRFNSGNILISNSGVREGDLTTQDLYLVNLDETWGLKLFEFQYIWGVNDGGTGFVVQSWVLGFADGKFSWSLVD
jgi:hypothetical protein